MIFKITPRVSVAPLLLFVSEVHAVEPTQKVGNTVLQDQLLSPTPIATSIWQMALGLIVVLLVIFTLAWLMKRVNGFQASKAHIKIISAVNVGAKERAVLVEVAGEQLLLGVTSGQVNLLHKLERPIVEDQADFSKSLKMADIKLSQQSTVAENNHNA